MLNSCYLFRLVHVIMDLSQFYKLKLNLINCKSNFNQQEVYHSRRQIKYSKDKMWYLAKLVSC